MSAAPAATWTCMSPEIAEMFRGYSGALHESLELALACYVVRRAAQQYARHREWVRLHRKTDPVWRAKRAEFERNRQRRIMADPAKAAVRRAYKRDWRRGAKAKADPGYYKRIREARTARKS